MEQWEYCLLWANPRKTVIVRSDQKTETVSNQNHSQGILTGLRADGWQTIAFDIEPTSNMTYLFKRRVRH